MKNCCNCSYFSYCKVRRPDNLTPCTYYTTEDVFNENNKICSTCIFRTHPQCKNFKATFTCKSWKSNVCICGNTLKAYYISPKFYYPTYCSPICEAIANGKYTTKVKCRLCGKSFASISAPHLKFIHNITVSEYCNQFPEAELMSLASKIQCTQNEPWNKGKTGPPAWNKGLTKETCSTVAQYAAKLSITNLGKPGTPVSDENKMRISKANSGENNGAKRPEVRAKISASVLQVYKDRPEVIEQIRKSVAKSYSTTPPHKSYTLSSGRILGVDSGWEGEMYDYLLQFGVKFKYTKEHDFWFQLDDNRIWHPDFLLRGPLILEVKGYPRSLQYWIDSLFPTIKQSKALKGYKICVVNRRPYEINANNFNEFINNFDAIKI